jgi:hypothetical protein
MIFAHLVSLDLEVSLREETFKIVDEFQSSPEQQCPCNPQRQSAMQMEHWKQCSKFNVNLFPFFLSLAK